jgi:PhzF family phenazine biosynthesis protein
MPFPAVTVVDAFTDTPFAGNSAAVCVLPAPRDERWMQAVARELKHAAHAFLLRESDEWRLRWFTPAAEVDLCGHATLASAHVLWDEGHAPRGELARFQTRSGLLTAANRDGWITLDFPATPPTPADAPPELAEALGSGIVAAYHTRFDWLVELENEAAVRAVAPDLDLVARLGRRGVIVTSRASSVGYDFVSRFFAPNLGLPEDPVTGSAHCALGPLWGHRLGRQELVGYQASPRGGTVRVTLRGGERVLLGGKAVTTLRGELLA